MRLIDADAIWDYEICGDIECSTCAFSKEGHICLLRERILKLPTYELEKEITIPYDWIIHPIDCTPTEEVKELRKKLYSSTTETDDGYGVIL